MRFRLVFSLDEQTHNVNQLHKSYQHQDIPHFFLEEKRHRKQAAAYDNNQPNIPGCKKQNALTYNQPDIASYP
jgi:hypothetical protein